ncbi:DivIVA domain-containing protein [Devriesea agamarum]|uniref:DivIVA domain-containing protein n=1 Tax=Devriesea agamarum TaxID=472569 RepID=UPI00071D3FDA|nr:DivIVA domain-containing protein [Devriesea agamarum]
MALMPEDLLNKRFTPVRFTEGYDMDEVDEYLDNDVMPRLQELIDENDRLTKDLELAKQRIAELESRIDAPVGAEVRPEFRPVEEPAVTAAVEETPKAPAARDEAPVPSDTTSAIAQMGADGADRSATGIIALAQRLHDEYVKNGEDERDRLIAEARIEHRRIIGEAEEKSRATLEQLEQRKIGLEKSIEQLRTFERDYRNRLRNYLESQLRDLETSETQDKQATFGL